MFWTSDLCCDSFLDNSLLFAVLHEFHLHEPAAESWLLCRYICLAFRHDRPASKATRFDGLSWRCNLSFSYDCLLRLRVKCWCKESLRCAAQSCDAGKVLLRCGLFNLQSDRTTPGTSGNCRGAKGRLACCFAAGE